MGLLIVGQCITMHDDYQKIVDRLVLEINLKLMWSCGIYETETDELNNENLRYSAYRSLHLW